MNMLKRTLIAPAFFIIGLASCQLQANENEKIIGGEKTETKNIDKELPIICGVPLYAGKEILKEDAFKSKKSLFDTEAKWKTKVLRVCFIDTKDTTTIGKTLRIANEWSIPGRIEFVRTVDLAKSDIRVSFRNKAGYSSMLGGAAGLATGDTTMFLQNLDRKSDSEFRRVVLHEFGHALGFRHELINPNSPIIWKEQAVFDYFQTVYKMDTNVIRRQILRPAVLGATKASDFDSASIMVYAIPAFLTENNKEIAWPYVLSKEDRATLAKYY